MAGSINHVTNETEDGRIYIGTNLLDNEGDMMEAIDEMAYVILSIWHRWGGSLMIPPLSTEYYECLRGEREWPPWWQPEDID